MCTINLVGDLVLKHLIVFSIVALAVACGGGDNNDSATNNGTSGTNGGPTTASNNGTTANNGTTSNNTSGATNNGTTQTTGTTELTIPDMPTDGEIVAVLTYEGNSVTIVCDTSNGGRYQALLGGGTLTFNTRNHPEICGDLQGTNFTFLNTPLDDTTNMPEASGTTPIDVQFEFDGVATRRSVHDSMAHSLTVTAGRDDGALIANFAAVWSDAEMYVWFNEPPFRRF